MKEFIFCFSKPKYKFIKSFSTQTRIANTGKSRIVDPSWWPQFLKKGFSTDLEKEISCFNPRSPIMNHQPWNIPSSKRFHSGFNSSLSGKFVHKRPFQIQEKQIYDMLLFLKQISPNFHLCVFTCQKFTKNIIWSLRPKWWSFHLHVKKWKQFETFTRYNQVYPPDFCHKRAFWEDGYGNVLTFAHEIQNFIFNLFFSEPICPNPPIILGLQRKQPDR